MIAVQYMWVCGMERKKVCEKLGVLVKVNWMIEEGIMLQTKCVEFMVIAYETIRHKKGDDAVREVVSEELMKILQQQSKEREESMRRTVILGKVVEREAVKLQASNSAKQASCSNSYLSGRALVRSVSGV